MTLDWMDLLFLLLSGISILVFGSFSILSIFEQQKRAAIRSLILTLISGSFFLITALLPTSIQTAVIFLFAAIVIITSILLFLPIGKVEVGNVNPSFRYDERDIMFARAFRDPHSAEMQSYYRMRPENKASDDLFREKPGLNHPDSWFYNPYLSACVDASFSLTEVMNKAVDGNLAASKHPADPKSMTSFVKGLAKYYGALDVRITQLQPWHVYSHIGRGEGEYGSPLPIEHKYAIAITVEMNDEMLGAAPHLPASMESARQYVESGRTVVQLAAAIRSLGFPARAHMDGNYRVICPLVARDAGLGEIGRMGLLITPSRGPRVRLAVVTTDLELIPDQYKPDESVLDFCTICKKCATVCPSQSIPHDDRKEINGVKRWQINSDTCFHYWCDAGTDCGKCMAVCPYSHPDNFFHNIIRFGIKKSGFFRRTANLMDDYFYGKKPTRRKPPQWIAID